MFTFLLELKLFCYRVLVSLSLKIYLCTCVTLLMMLSLFVFQTKWMMYWIVFALFLAAEMVLDTFVSW